MNRIRNRNTGKALSFFLCLCACFLIIGGADCFTAEESVQSMIEEATLILSEEPVRIDLEESARIISEEPAQSTVEKPLRIVATIFPVYDWVTEIIGENPAQAEVTLLLDHGVDLHSYQPTAADIRKLSDCDLFLYIGGESDDWVKDALLEARNPDLIAISLIDVLGDYVREEELAEGMQLSRQEKKGCE